MRRMLAAVASGVILLSGALTAHHANAVFDLGKRLTLTGTVTEWFWANPHCLLRFDVTWFRFLQGTDGLTLQRSVPGGLPLVLQRIARVNDGSGNGSSEFAGLRNGRRRRACRRSRRPRSMAA